MVKRTVHINQQPWQYIVGGSGVKFFSPTGKTAYVMYNKLYPGVDVERGQWKRWFHVLPSHIKDYIEKNLL